MVYEFDFSPTNKTGKVFSLLAFFYPGHICFHAISFISNGLLINSTNQSTPQEMKERQFLPFNRKPKSLVNNLLSSLCKLQTYLATWLWSHIRLDPGFFIVKDSFGNP